MDLFSLFKKDYINYLLSIILPAVISGLSIPVFKHLLGAEGYGLFSIWLNAVLIGTAVLSAWITQSIIRFYPTATNKLVFSKKAIQISLYTQALFFIPSFLLAWYVSGDFVLAVLCSLLLFAVSIQFTLLPIIQSGFLSKKIIWSEFIRIVSYVALAIGLLIFSQVKYIYALFLAVLVSYVLSLFYLIRQMLLHTSQEQPASVEIKILFKDFLRFGAPFSAWFIFSYLLSYVDKLYTLKHCGGEAQGNYQAIFDLIYKSITLIISPAITSIYPILTAAYTKGDRTEIKKLILKIIRFELAGFIIAAVAYWTFGAKLLLSILNIKTAPTTYMWIGFIVLCGAFVWQLAILAQKKYELKMKTSFLLAMVVVALIAQLCFYAIFDNLNRQLLYPLGFLLSAVVYLILISFDSLLQMRKSANLQNQLR